MPPITISPNPPSPPSDNQSWYHRYLRSRAWRQRRKVAIAEAGYHCQRCGQGGRLEVHHKHYKTLGRERLRDMVVCCHGCHQALDRGSAGDRVRERAAAVERRRQQEIGRSL